MKTLLLSTLAACLLLGSSASFADRDDGRHWKQNRHDNGYHRGWDRGDSRWDNRRRGHDHDHVSINLGFGNSWGYPTGSYFGFGVGTSRWVNPPTRWINRDRPVVIYQNNYIHQTAPRTSTRVITRSAPRSGLLRDVNGRCFERQYDRNGNETRIEIPPSECNF